MAASLLLCHPAVFISVGTPKGDHQRTQGVIMGHLVKWVGFREEEEECGNYFSPLCPLQ